MEFAESGDVQSLIQSQLNKRKYLAEKDIWAYAWQMCMGILHIHSKGIIHRDIKCMNLLIKNGVLKLGDMSESRMLSSQAYIKTNKMIGTPLSLSPEVVKNQGYDQRSDIWGLGVALYTLACLQPPFYEDNMQALTNAIVFKQPKPITQYS
jgi:serine/threonine protein kinase